MTYGTAHTTESLFTAYIRLRQNGLSMDDSVNKLQDAAQQVSREARHRLGDMVMSWEEKFGKNPSLSFTTPKGPATETNLATPKPPPVNGQQKTTTQSMPAAFIPSYLDTSPLAAAQPAAAPAMIACRQCGRQNMAGSTFCTGCGQLLQPRPIAPTRQLDAAEQKATFQVSDYFSADATLLIAIRGVKSVLETSPRDKMVIGRGESPVPGQPFVDLSPYDGEMLGVSRVHAEIRFLNNTLVLSDLDSDNGTFVNDLRLYPYEIRVLHHNDELRLGKLLMKVSFRVPMRR